jgi:hypothetical protein
MLSVLMGLTYAGTDLTVERFFAGTKAFDAYRYNALDGRTTDASHFRVTVGAPDGSQIGDVSEVVWNPQEMTKGNTTIGTYDYSTKRYAPGHHFT